MQEPVGFSSVKKGSDRIFGLVMGIIFLGLTLISIPGHPLFSLFLALTALVLLVLGIFKPELLSYPNSWWFKFGMLLGAIVSPVVMAAIYFLVITPISLILRVTKRTPLRKSFDSEIESYWIDRPTPVGSMKNQF